jgi:hypothetical protein
VVCFLAEATDLLSIQNIRHLVSCSVDVVDPSPALKELMHEADHSPLSSEVTDQCSCNCASYVCLHGVLHRDIVTFYHRVEGMTACMQFCPTENEGSIELLNSVSFYSTVLCQNTECCYLKISFKHGSLETSVYVAFPSLYCSSAVFVSGLFICSSTLTALWTHDTKTSSLCFLMFRGSEMF